MTTPTLIKGQGFTVQFPARGNYKLVCLVHENMTGTVPVLESGAQLPFTQEDYDDLAAAQSKRLLADSRSERDFGASSFVGDYRSVPAK